jgi:hypothetical protein
VKRCIKWYWPSPIDQNEPLGDECVHTTEEVESHRQAELLQTLEDAATSVSEILDTPWTNQTQQSAAHDT